MLGSARVQPTVAAADIERSREFYEGLLGCEPIMVSEAGVAYRMGSGTGFFLYPSQNAGTDQGTHMSFVVDDIEATVAALRHQGVEFEEYDFPGLKTVNGIAVLPGEGRTAWFKDPAGNILAVLQSP